MDMKEYGEIDVEIDGIYCPKCHELHPTLHWHDKYEEYLERNQWIRSHKKAVERFKISLSPEQLSKAYDDHLGVLGLILDETHGECVVCANHTHFRHAVTGHFLCSDECMYTDWRIYGYTLAMSADPVVFMKACHTLEQQGIYPAGELLEDVDGSLIRYYSYHQQKIRVASDYEIDAVFIDSQVNLSEVLKGMVLHAYKH